MNRRMFAAILPCCAIHISMSMAAGADTEMNLAEGNSEKLQTIVVTATAIPGAAIDIDKIPGNVQVLSAADLTREGSASLTNALNSNLSSVNINDPVAHTHTWWAIPGQRVTVSNMAQLGTVRSTCAGGNLAQFPQPAVEARTNP